MLIWKVNRDIHFSMVYRKLNITKKDCLLPPVIENTLNMFAETKWFSPLH
jgi:hypothetical protein